MYLIYDNKCENPVGVCVKDNKLVRLNHRGNKSKSEFLLKNGGDESVGFRRLCFFFASRSVS